jgi:hypothetical protein
MLDLAISTNTDPKGTTVVETNRGMRLKAPTWPQDCDFQLVLFDPSGERCEIVLAEQLAADIGRALAMLDSAQTLRGPKPNWYRRLKDCASGTLLRQSDRPVRPR